MGPRARAAPLNERKRTMNARRLSDLPDILTADEAAEVLRLGRSSVYEAIRLGLLPGLRIGRRILIPKAALQSMLDTQSAAGLPRKDE